MSQTRTRTGNRKTASALGASACAQRGRHTRRGSVVVVPGGGTVGLRRPRRTSDRKAWTVCSWSGRDALNRRIDAGLVVACVALAGVTGAVLAANGLAKRPMFRT